MVTCVWLTWKQIGTLKNSTSQVISKLFIFSTSHYIHTSITPLCDQTPSKKCLLRRLSLLAEVPSALSLLCTQQDEGTMSNCTTSEMVGFLPEIYTRYNPADLRSTSKIPTTEIQMRVPISQSFLWLFQKEAYELSKALACPASSKRFLPIRDPSTPEWSMCRVPTEAWRISQWCMALKDK
jgi:hypothetical protein